MKRVNTMLSERHKNSPAFLADALVALVDYRNNGIELPEQYGEWFQELKVCVDKTGMYSSCLLDMVEKAISPFLSNMKALSEIVAILNTKYEIQKHDDILMIKSYINEVYLTSRGMSISKKRQKLMFEEIKKDILHQQEVSGRNKQKIASLEMDLKENEQIDKRQTELIDDLENQLLQKASLDDEQTTLINQLQSAFVEKTLVDMEQDQVITRLEKILQQKEVIDERQTESLIKIKEELINKSIKDIEQSSAISHLEFRVSDLTREVERMKQKYYEAAEGALDRDKHVYQKINKHFLLITGITAYMILLSLILFLRS